MYIANYKGGRNESFMYGIDNNTTWYDYDLTSAYTTGMALLGNPDYKAAFSLSVEELKEYNAKDLILNYIIMRVNFVLLQQQKR